MTANEQKELAEKIAQTAFKALDDKKGMDVQILDVVEHTSLADYFVIATGTSNTHVHALADEVEFRVKEALEISPLHVEGHRGNIWVLMDYGSVVVHLFTREGREFYNLEKLWKQ